MPRAKAILLLTAALAFATAPFFARSFRGFEPEDFPVPVTAPPVQPAAYAFSIWTLIYLWLILHAGYGLLRRDRHPDWDRPRWPLVLALALGASWLEVARLAPVMAVAQIWIMLAAALLALFRTPAAPDRWLLLAPLAVFAGWLTAAAPVALGVVAQGYGLAPETAATVAALALILAVAAAVQVRLDRAPEYGLTVVWALAGVVVANLDRVFFATLAVAGIAAMTAAVVAATR